MNLTDEELSTLKDLLTNVNDYRDVIYRKILENHEKAKKWDLMRDERRKAWKNITDELEKNKTILNKIQDILSKHLKMELTDGETLTKIHEVCKNEN